MGLDAYPDARPLLITADAGGSNSYRCKLWKVELARLAADTGIDITVLHYPPGTSKWSKIEHRLFSQITMNWRGRPFISHDVVVTLCRHHHPNRAHGQSRTRPRLLPDRYQDPRQTTPS